MTNRIQSLDVARGFTVFIMPAVHTVMLYSQPAVHGSWLGYILAFLAEGPGAQLFMFLLGFSIVLSRPKTGRQVLKRVLILLCAGYLLNFLRLVLPYQLGILPETLVHEYIVYSNHSASLSLLLTGDILQMAAIAYSIVWLLQRTKHVFVWSGIVVLFVIFSAPFVWGLRFESIIADHIAGLFIADDYRAFFPLFPWLCYPMAGFLLGIIFKGKPIGYFYKLMVIAGVVLLVGGLALNTITPAHWDKDFYRPGPARNIYQTGFVMLWICLAALFMKFFGQSYFSKLLGFCARNITVIYVIQWVLIAWGTAVAGYQTLSMLPSVIAMCLTTILTLLLTWLYVNRHAVPGFKSKLQQVRFR